MTDTEQRYHLVVTVPDERTFNTYWYGYGVVTDIAREDESSWVVTVDYGTDKYRADYQAGRFWSGLYPAHVFLNSSDS